MATEEFGGFGSQKEQVRHAHLEANEKLTRLFASYPTCQKCLGIFEVLYNIFDVPSAVRCCECGQIYDLDGQEDNTRWIWEDS